MKEKLGNSIKEALAKLEILYEKDIKVEIPNTIE